MEEFDKELWEEAGWDDLDEAKRWHEAGWGRQLSEEEYEELSRYGRYLPDFPEVKGNERIVDEIIDAYLFRHVVGWDDPREAYKWYLYDIFPPQDALSFYKAGWDVFEVDDWLVGNYDRSTEIGKLWLDNPVEALRWKEAGWENAKEAYEWYRDGWRDPEEAMKWRKSGRWKKPSFAYEWYSAGWRDPKEASEWSGAWFRQTLHTPGPEEILKWHTVGWEDPEKASEWYKAGWRDPEEALMWYKAGWRDAKKAFTWRESGEWDPNRPGELRIAYRIHRTLNVNDPVEAKKIAEQMSVAEKKRPPRLSPGR